jgi:ABC-type sugar transport system ATPase subunit
MLEFKGISKSFKGVKALNKVSFSIPDGEIHGIVGENGAGKSTLMKILSGVYPPDSGRIELDSSAVAFDTPEKAYDAGVRIVHQELSLIRSLTIAQNMFIHRFRRAKLKFIDQKLIEAEAAEMLREWQIDIPPSSLVSELSMGTRQLVEIARELSTGGRIIILDEPTSSLTFKEIDLLFSVLRLLRGKGYIIIFISHRLNEVIDLVDRITVLRDGEVVATAETRELDTAQIINLIAGRDLRELFPKTPAPIGSVALEVRNLSGKGFKDISFKVHWGEVLGVAGLVGSGRSELVRTIYGVNEYRGGEILLEDRPVRIKSPKEAIRMGISLLSEDREAEGMFPDLSVSKNLIILKIREVLKNYFLSKSKMGDKAARLVNELNIVTYDQERQIVSELSGGNKQKVVLGRLTGSKPKILLLDEPTRGVDIANKTEIHKIMGRFLNQGGAVVMVSSELNELIGVSDRILVLNEGEFGAVYERNEFEKEEILRCMMKVCLAA